MPTAEKDSVLDDDIIVAPENEKEEVAPEPAKRKSRVPIYVVSGISLLSAVIGLGWWLYARQFVTTDDAFIEGNVTVVSPKISAHVAKIHVKENQPVKKGDLLIELEPHEARAKLEQAQATLLTALAKKGKATANVALTRSTGRAGINQAATNLQTARTNIEQTQIASSSKQDLIVQAHNRAKTAEANLRQVQAQIPAAEAGVTQAKAQVPVANNKLEVARLERDRDQKLFDAGVISKQKLEQTGKELVIAQGEATSAEKQVDIALSRLDSLRRQVEVESARLNEAKAAIVTAENDYRQSQAQVQSVASQADESEGRLQEAQSLPQQVAVEESEVSAADAEIRRAEAAVAQAQLEYEHTKIYAPQDGYISQRAVQEGQLVQPEQSLMAITPPEIWIVANFKETQIEKIQVGQTVDVYVDAYPSQVFRGRVDSFQAGTGSRFSVLPSENATGNYVKVVQRIPVKIVFDPAPDKQKYLLVPGMSVVPKVRVRNE